MAGMGRGNLGKYLQAMKEKKEEEQKRFEEAKPGGIQLVSEAVTSPASSPSLQRHRVQIVSEQSAISTSPPKTVPRMMGRGLISSLINRQVIRQAPMSQPEEEIPKSIERRISPVQEVSKPVQKIVSQVQEPKMSILTNVEEPVESKPIFSFGRGRGLLSAKITKPVVKPGEEELIRREPERTVIQEQETKQEIKQVSTIMEKMKISETIAHKVEQQQKRSEVGSVEDKSKKSSNSVETRYMSIATVSSKATEELKVEHIMRKSPVRKMGSSGKETDFATNYIKLKCVNQGVYQYVVNYNPPIDSQYQRIKLFYQLGEITGRVRLFDGFTLFLPILLPDKVTTCNVTRQTENGTIDYEIKIQLTKILPPEQVPPSVFSIIFKNIMKELKMSRIGQHYFSPLRQIDVSTQNLKVWPGYTTAVHDYEDGLFLVVDIAHKVLRSQTVLQLMNDLSLKHQNIEDFKQAAFNSLCGNIVLTKYNNKTYKVDDILWEQSPKQVFTYHNGEKISYIEYYKKHYDINIVDTKQPLLLHRVKTKDKKASPTGARDYICLIPELCFMTGLDEELRNDQNLKRDLATHTRLSPSQRYEQLQILIDKIRSTPEALKQITNWGLELEPNLDTMDGRILPPEKILFARKEFEVDAKCDWTRPAGNEECVSSVELKTWLFVYPQNKESQVEKFYHILSECGRRIGIRVAFPHTIPLPNDKPDTYYSEIKKNLTDHVQMVVVVFPMLSDSRYTRVKRLCCIEMPVPSQVMVFKTINKQDNQLRSVAQKIILQMNVKLGGEIWRLNIPMKRIMIIGIDVYHKIEKKYKSIAGFVSSLNNDQTRWYSKICFQMVGQELGDTLKTAFLQSIRKYQEVNKFLPEKIFIFRDGVSEGQIPIVSEHEVSQFKSCFTEDYRPQISVIIVQKRISTRLFALSPQSNQIINPAPGAIIDYRITSKELYDFYLVSQHVGQGTVTPTHYIVAYDDTNLKPDHIQRLSYKMTHMYYNWSGTIRVPAPCQYAHKLAFLTGQYLQEEASDALCDRLFYL